ncbi:MAG: 1-deoxy-D-xylulose-5-phosphate synthase, partial [Duncaniella sp.]|nr:1-deoxy-D-xylulose-5-phosphate synthase [Duncaniella sp.]
IGPVASETRCAIERAEKEFGISVAHYDMIFLKPMDTEIISRIVAMNVPVITVEDGVADGGMGSAVLEALSDAGSDVPVHRLGVPDRFIPQGKPSELKHLCGFDADGIYEAIAKIANPVKG